MVIPMKPKRLTTNEKKRIVEAIRCAERLTSGEIRVHVRGRSRDPLRDAANVFSKHGMHRTAERNGVLIFVAVDSRSFAIVGDEGIHRQAGSDLWDRTRDSMADEFKKGDLAGGIVAGVEKAGEALGRFFPRKTDDVNELDDEITTD